MLMNLDSLSGGVLMGRWAVLAPLAVFAGVHGGAFPRTGGAGVAGPTGGRGEPADPFATQPVARPDGG